jgi:hypothetical protein
MYSVAGQRAEQAIRAVLPRSVKVHATHGDESSDLTINGARIEVKWLGEGELRRVRELLSRGRRRPNVVVARHMSPGAREALSGAGIGWVDETGAAEIVLGLLVISKSGTPVTRRKKSARWTQSVLAVSEALLCGTTATVAETQKATGLSTGICTYALRVLTELGFLTSDALRGRASARRVVDQQRLLTEYSIAAASITPRASLSLGVTWQDIVVGLGPMARRAEKAGINCVVTGAAAAAVIAPLLTSVSTATVYVDASTIAELDTVASKLNLRPIEGGRITIAPFPTVTTARLADANYPFPIAPWPRIYADLRMTGVRGEEAAEHLREVVHAG